MIIAKSLRNFSRSFGNKGASSYPMSMQDKYSITPINTVPKHIVRPGYVGTEPQEHPSLDGPIHILNKQQ